MSLCFLPLSGCGQEDELGHEEDILSVEGPGPGGDQYCSSVQFPGSARAHLPAARPQRGTKNIESRRAEGEERSSQEPCLQGSAHKQGVLLIMYA